MTHRPADHQAARTRGPARRVRPRLVWGGTLVALAGCSVAAVGLITMSWLVTLSGGAALVVGAFVAHCGGILRDTSNGGVRSELAHLIHGRDRQGVAPGDMVTSPRAVATSRRVDRRRRRLERAAARAPRPVPIRPIGGVLVLVTVVLLVSQWTLYPVGLPGQSNATRALGCAVVLGLAGMRVIEAGAGRTLTASVAAALAAGLLLTLNGAVADHARSVTATVEVTCGLLCVLCAGSLARGLPRG